MGGGVVAGERRDRVGVPRILARGYREQGDGSVALARDGDCSTSEGGQSRKKVVPIKNRLLSMDTLGSLTRPFEM